MFFPQNLDFLLKNKDLNQTKLAKQLGKTKATISDYKLGRSKPTFDGLIILSQFLEISIDELIFKDLIAVKYNGVAEEQGKYHTSKRKAKVCFLTGGECMFTEMDLLRTKNAALEEELAALKKKN